MEWQNEYPRELSRGARSCLMQRGLSWDDEYWGIKRNSWTCNTIEHLAAALKINPYVKTLNVSHNYIGVGDEPTAKHDFSDALAVNRSLKTLQLACCGIGPKTMNYLAKALKINSSLTKIDFTRNKIRDEGAQYLAASLKINSSLTDIDLTRCDIGAVGLCHLAEALKVNSALSKLCLEGNKVGAEGALHLAEALKVNSSLGLVNLKWCNIGNAGITHLAEALKVSTSIKWLNVCGNKIAIRGAYHLSEALKVNTSVMGLDLGRNKIDAKGLLHLSEALKVNSSIRRLGLEKCNIGDEDVHCLADAVRVNVTVTDLFLQDNDVCVESMWNLEKAHRRSTPQSRHSRHRRTGIRVRHPLLERARRDLSYRDYIFYCMLYGQHQMMPEDDLFVGVNHFMACLLTGMDIQIIPKQPLGRMDLNRNSQIYQLQKEMAEGGLSMFDLARADPSRMQALQQCMRLLDYKY
eukprot:m.345668 g.345668  ORF g.345668 m.345668 type:complete len:464 (-) comp16141_c1_seq13:245-1636(-)